MVRRNRGVLERDGKVVARSWNGGGVEGVERKERDGEQRWERKEGKKGQDKGAEREKPEEVSKRTVTR